MTYSYSGDPSDSEVDAVRFLIGDTDASDWLLTDEEIQWTVTVRGNAYIAAPYAAESIGAKLSRESDSSKSVGDLSLSKSLSSRAKHFFDLADRLYAMSGSLDPPVVRFNDNAIGPEFYVGQMDNLKTNPNEIVQ
jgi:hypothetical protein